MFQSGPKIAACMIVRNSTEVIEEAISSVRPWVDEINVFDTGSTDGTPEFLEELGANQVAKGCKSGHLAVLKKEELAEHNVCRICGSEWNEDIIELAPIRVEKAGDDLPVFDNGSLANFSWAREKSLDMCSEDVDWFIWLDDDDTVMGGHFIRTMAARAHATCDGYLVYYDYAHDDHGNVSCELWRERLVRLNREGFHWKNRVHEVWLPRDSKTPSYIMVPRQQMQYVHRRPDDRYPADRNLIILQREVEEVEAAGGEPDMRTLIYLGTEHMARAKWDEAAKWLERYLNDPRSTPGDERSQGYHKLALCMRALDRVPAAIGAEQQAINERDDWAENHIGLAECFGQLGDWARSEREARTALAIGKPGTTLIINPLEHSFVVFMRLAQATAMQGRYEEASSWVQKALEVDPDNQLALGLAEAIKNDGYAAAMVEASLKLRECLIRFDENQKAWELMNSLPYIIEDNPAIVSAKAMTRENVRHMLEPEEYIRWYQEEPKESPLPDEAVPDIGEYIERAKSMLDICKEKERELGRKPRVLDLGANDMWLAAYLWVRGGFEVDGIELNKQAVEKGKGRIERFGLKSKLVQGDIHNAVELVDSAEKYDVVSMFEVLEHVPDVDRTLSVCESLLAEGGVVLLSTPNGAFENGDLPYWNIVERKGHLRAIPQAKLAELLMARGKIEELQLHSQGRLSFASYRPGKRKGRINFFAGGSWESWKPADIRTRGIGGSETMLSRIAIGLAERDWDVRVYVDTDPQGFFGGALFRPASAFDPSESVDAVVVSRIAEAFDVQMAAPVRALWCHDHTYPQLTPERIARLSHVVALSNWHKERFERLNPDTVDKLTVIRNGIFVDDIKHGKRGFAKRKPRVIYSSSADRGLDHLLEWWPEIRKIAPEAELHVFYGWDVFDAVAKNAPQLLQFKQKVFKLYEDAGGEEGGIFMRGRIGQDQLYQEMQLARVWGYPTYFQETSCITAMEARTSGLAIVTSDLAALSETVGEGGTLLKVEFGSEHPDQVILNNAYMKAFSTRVGKLLTVESQWNPAHLKALKGVEQFDLSHALDAWESMIEEAR